MLNLKVKPTKSKLNKLHLIEHIDNDILNALINSSLLREEFHNKIVSSSFSNERKQLLKYQELVKSGKAIVVYNKAKGMKYGRVTPFKSLGLFSIRREIRHTLARDNYIDLDICNCHPVMLLQICEANNIPVLYLKQYVDNRDQLLNEVKETYDVDRDKAKKIFIQLMYFGTFEGWVKDKTKQPTQFIQDFTKELQTIGDVIDNNNPELKMQIMKRKEAQGIDEYNDKGTLCSYYLQEYENQVLETIYFHCVEKGYITNNSCVLAADGLMIPKLLYKPEILDEFHDVVLKKFGFNLKFTTKDMDQGYTLQQLEDTKINSEVEMVAKDEEAETIGVHNDLQAAKVVYAKYPHWVCCNSELYVFDNTTGLWSSDEQLHMKIICSLEKFLYVLIPTADEDVFKIGKKGYGNSTTLQRQMIPLLKTLCIDNDWLRNKEGSSLKKLLFLDGYLNMLTGRFHKKFNPDILFMHRIQYNYNGIEDEEYIKYIEKKIIYRHYRFRSWRLLYFTTCKRNGWRCYEKNNFWFRPH